MKPARSGDKERSSPLQAMVVLLLLAGIAGLVLWRMEPPSPVYSTAPADRFSAERALRHVQAIGQAPHYTGFPDHTRVRVYLKQQLAAIGATVREQAGIGVRRVRDTISAAVVHNVMGILPGTDRTLPAILLTAHYDSVATGPGAADDGSGIATLLEVGRALSIGPKQRPDIVLLCTDGEERGLLGAEVFCRDDPLRMGKQIGLVLNLEARGRGGPVYMFETSDGNRTGPSQGNAVLIGHYARAVPHPLAHSLAYALYKQLPNDTDLTVFREAGIPGLNFAFIDDIQHYHTALDAPEYLDPRSVQQEGDAVLALVRRLANADLGTLGGGNAIFFDVLGLFVITYPVTGAIPLTILAGVLTVAAIVLGMRRRLLTPDAIFAGALLSVLLLVIIGGGGLLLWRAILLLSPALAVSPWGRPYTTNLFAIAFSCLAVALIVTAHSLFRRRWKGDGIFAGVLLFWVALSVLVSWKLPEASYPFNLPLITAAVGLFFLPDGKAASWRRIGIFAVAVLPALLIWVVLARALFSMVGMSLVPAPLIAVTLLCTLLLPLLDVIQTGLPRLLPIVATVAALCLIGVAIRPVYDRDHRRVDTLLYAQDITDGHSAVWATLDAHPDDWVSSYLQTDRRTLPGSDLFPFLSGKVIAADARYAGLPPARIERISETVGATGRTICLKIIPARKATGLLVYTDDRVTGMTIGGEALPVEKKPVRLHFSAPPSTGLDMTITVPDGQKINLTVDEITHGFGDLPIGVLTTPRPSDTMPAPNFHPFTDIVLVRRREPGI